MQVIPRRGVLRIAAAVVLLVRPAAAQHTLLLDPTAATVERVAASKAAGAAEIALRLELITPPKVDDPKRPLHRFHVVLEDGPLELAIERECFLAAGRVRGAGLKLAYWLEVARQPALAVARPQYVLPRATSWIALTSVEGGRLHAAWIEALLREPLPQASTWFLAALQEGPGACGCEEPACQSAPFDGTRADGLRPATPNAAALLVEQVRSTLAEKQTSGRSAHAAAVANTTSPIVVPVWLPGCESGHDAPLVKHRCLRSCALQVRPLASGHEALALLLLAPLRSKSGATGDATAWIDATLRQFSSRLETPALTPDHLVAVIAALELDGRARDGVAVAAEVAAAKAAGARGVVVAEAQLPQGR